MKLIHFFIISILALLLSIKYCYPATKTINQWGSGNYTTLTTWEAGEQGVLTSTAYAVITGSWTLADTSVIINGWITYSTAPIIIQATGLARHTGVFNDKAYRLQPGNLINQAIAITLYPKDIQIDGLQFNIIGGAGQGDYAITDYYDYGIPNGMAARNISNCIITRDTTSASDIKNDHAIDMNILFSSQTWKIWNNIIYNWGIAFNHGTMRYDTTDYLYNNTLYNCSYTGNYAGIFMSADGGNLSSLYMYNNLVYGTTNNYGIYNFDANRYHHGNNVSIDDTSPDTAYRFQSASFISNTSDYHLLSADTTAYAKGSNRSADVNFSFNTDIDGQLRPTNWSIGADDIPAVSTRKRRYITILFQ
jgi:hypothetical protein